MRVARHEVPGKKHSRPSGTVEKEYLAFLKRHDLKFQANMPGTNRHFSRPYGTRHFFLSPNQALRARLLSCCPSGTKASLGAFRARLGADPVFLAQPAKVLTF
jgi:hypothetical protein